MSELRSIAGCILAGGQSQRMGEDKAWVELVGWTLLQHAIETLTPQVSALIINSHRDNNDLPYHELPVVMDATGERQGPLAGILAALRWAEDNKTDWMATVAVDTPFFPHDLVSRLEEAARGKDMACARSGGRLHPVFGLWRARLADELERQIANGLRSVHRWVELHDVGYADWPTKPYDPFFNINTPEDVDIAWRILTESYHDT